MFLCFPRFFPPVPWVWRGMWQRSRWFTIIPAMCCMFVISVVVVRVPPQRGEGEVDELQVGFFLGREKAPWTSPRQVQLWDGSNLPLGQAKEIDSRVGSTSAESLHRSP
eukprot:Sspe_Gene.62814::Locus_35536_Transcript_4_4_Confidence_0.571_Length_490::g.62814::m.62814